jgi:hypothetical protein
VQDLQSSSLVNTSQSEPAISTDPVADGATSDASVPITRTLHVRHFNKALREITPSSSESLGSLSALRKWNEEFGEGQMKKRKVMWGKGLFGFSESSEDQIPDGKVSSHERKDGVEGHRNIRK